MSVKKSTNTKRILLVSIIACVLVLISIGVYAFIARGQGLWPYQSTTTSDPTPAQNDNSSTSEPTYTGEKTKDGDTNQTPTPLPTTENGKKMVSVTTSPTIVDDYVEVRSSVSGVVEDGGTCTAVFSKDGTNLTYTSSAFTNVSSTQCELIRVKTSDFAKKGNWQLKVSYTSTASEGSSSSVEVKL